MTLTGLGKFEPITWCDHSHLVEYPPCSNYYNITRLHKFLVLGYIHTQAQFFTVLIYCISQSSDVIMLTKSVTKQTKDWQSTQNCPCTVRNLHKWPIPLPAFILLHGVNCLVLMSLGLQQSLLIKVSPYMIIIP